MAPEALLPAELSPVPPIILLVEDDADTRDMYSVYLESKGMWMATAPDPAAAADLVVALKPDLIVADIGFRSQTTGLAFAHAIRHDQRTVHVPIVLLTGRPADLLPASAREDADLLLIKPVLPDDLLGHINVLLRRSRELRARNQAALERAADLVKKSNVLRARTCGIQKRIRRATERRCPTCAEPLQLVETGAIDGVKYDYYYWCGRGCGLFCSDRDSLRWITLAG